MRNDVWLQNRIHLLSPVFIKMGQMMSQRADLIGVKLSNDLKICNDNVTVYDQISVKTIVESHNIMHEFQYIEEKAFACASIAQVHKCITKNGNHGVIKIKKNNVTKKILSDLSVLRYLVDIFDNPRISNHFNEFERVLTDELNFKEEIQNIKMFRNFYKHNVNVRIPKVSDVLSFDDMITMEYVPGEDLIEYSSSMSTLRRVQFSRSILNIFINQLLSGNFIHGDPHQGNIRINNDHIILYDFGNILYIREETMLYLKMFIIHSMQSNPHGMLQSLKSIPDVIIHDEETALQYMKIYLQYIKTMNAKDFQTIGSSTVPFDLSDELLRLSRVFMMIEGTCLKIDPDFSYMINDNNKHLEMVLQFLPRVINLNTLDIKSKHDLKYFISSLITVK